MKNFPYSFFLLIFLLSSCAGKYSALMPDKVKYGTDVEGEKVSIQYKYDMVKLRGNNKIAKKAKKKGIKIVTARITNHTDRPLVFGEELKLFTGNRELVVMSPQSMYNNLSQATPLHLLYLLLTPVRLTVTQNGRVTSNTPIGYVLGPVLAAVNVGVAASANKNMKKDFATQNLLGKTIPPGESVYGLIGLQEMSYSPLSLKIVGP